MENKKLKGLLFFVLLFLLVGAVAASEDNATDTVSIPDDTQDDIQQVTDANDNLAYEDDDYEDYDDYDDEYYYDEYDDEYYDEPSDLYIVPGKTTYSGTAGNQITVKVTVYDLYTDAPVKNADVTFSINGHTYTAKTTSKGVASVSFKLPKTKATTTSKTKGNILTKKTTYSKTYTCTATVEHDDYYSDYTTFNVKSTKKTVTKKYKIIKKKKTYTIKVKNGYKSYKKPYSHYIETYKFKSGAYTYILSAVSKKDNPIKFFIKHHYKKNGKWKWTSWKTIKKGYYNEYSFTSGIKSDKIQVRYTQVSYKKIK